MADKYRVAVDKWDGTQWEASDTVVGNAQKVAKRLRALANELDPSEAPEAKEESAATRAGRELGEKIALNLFGKAFGIDPNSLQEKAEEKTEQTPVQREHKKLQDNVRKLREQG